LLARRLSAIVSTTPSYSSLLVCFNPSLLGRAALHDLLQQLLNDLEQIDQPRGVTWEIPACFGGRYAPDRKQLEVALSTQWDVIVHRFCSIEFTVRAIGFVPGFTYLGGLPPDLHCTRMMTPRARVPASSIAIAGNQAGIYPFDSPGGWRILGRLPFAVFDTADEPPAIFSPGDQLRFKPVDETEFASLAEQPRENVISVSVAGQ
ncbi:MAG TPA: allophanate hydrolase subunit 1, partial [Halieaceae bacterium]|nr:allophanate hydrolase subunit 1 [Halieaceae bacterium]